MEGSSLSSGGVWRADCGEIMKWKLTKQGVCGITGSCEKVLLLPDRLPLSLSVPNLYKWWWLSPLDESCPLFCQICKKGNWLKMQMLGRGEVQVWTLYYWRWRSDSWPRGAYLKHLQGNDIITCASKKLYFKHNEVKFKKILISFYSKEPVCKKLL